MEKEALPRENPQAYLEEIASLKATVARQSLLIQYYESQLLQAKRRQFGSSSEKSDADCRQLDLFGEAEAMTPEPELEIEDIHYQRKKHKGKREEDLSGLPVERIDYELPESERVCPQCGDTMRDIGVDVRRELELIPARVIVVEHAAHAYACKQCAKDGEGVPVVRANTPVPLIAGSLASASLVAHIAVQKYMNAMPLYRLEKGFAYDGVNISRQTMSNWVIKCAMDYLLAVYVRLKSFLLQETVLHADETTVQVLHEIGRPAQTKSYEWLYRTSGCAERKVVIYDYQETREQKHPLEFLKDFKGFLHTMAIRFITTSRPASPSSGAGRMSGESGRISTKPFPKRSARIPAPRRRWRIVTLYSAWSASLRPCRHKKDIKSGWKRASPLPTPSSPGPRISTRCPKARWACRFPTCFPSAPISTMSFSMGVWKSPTTAPSAALSPS